MAKPPSGGGNVVTLCATKRELLCQRTPTTFGNESPPRQPSISESHIEGYEATLNNGHASDLSDNQGSPLERTPIRRFVTENSVYLIDSDRYMRLPKNESQRPVNESWRLVDGEWLPLREWHIEDHPEGGKRLRLFTPDAVFGVQTSPIVESNTEPDLYNSGWSARKAAFVAAEREKRVEARMRSFGWVVQPVDDGGMVAPTPTAEVA